MGPEVGKCQEGEKHEVGCCLQCCWDSRGCWPEVARGCCLAVAPVAATACSTAPPRAATPYHPVSANQQFHPRPPPCRACGRSPCTRRRRARPCMAWAVSDAALLFFCFAAGLDRAGCCCSRSVPQHCVPAAVVLTSHERLHQLVLLDNRPLKIPLVVHTLHALPPYQRPNFHSDPPATPHSHPLQAWATPRRACPLSVT